LVEPARRRLQLPHAGRVLQGRRPRRHQPGPAGLRCRARGAAGRGHKTLGRV